MHIIRDIFYEAAHTAMSADAGAADGKGKRHDLLKWEGYLFLENCSREMLSS